MGSVPLHAPPACPPVSPPPVHPFRPWVEARLFPVNTSPLTCAFFLYDFSCFDETLLLAVQVPKRGLRPRPGQPVIQELCSQAQPHTQPAFRGGHNLHALCEWGLFLPPSIPMVPTDTSLSLFPAD